jgi:hypothetical protein
MDLTISSSDIRLTLARVRSAWLAVVPRASHPRMGP